MARFTAIPSIPSGTVTDWQSQLLNALKEDVELLCNIRGEADSQSAAVTKGNIGVKSTPAATFTRVSATGNGYTISGQNVADLDDYAKLILNVQELANDVAYLRSVVNTMIVQLKG